MVPEIPAPLTVTLQPTFVSLFSPLLMKLNPNVAAGWAGMVLVEPVWSVVPPTLTESSFFDKGFGIQALLDWLVDMKGLSRDDAYMLASATMDLVVTQAVDGTRGIHALMPKAIFRKTTVAR